MKWHLRLTALVLVLALAGVCPWGPAAGQETQIRQAFELLDGNGDGRISRQEFQLNKTQIFYRSLRRAGETSSLKLEDSSLTPEAFAEADTDGDGVLSGSEWSRRASRNSRPTMATTIRRSASRSLSAACANTCASDRPRGLGHAGAAPGR